MPHSNYKQSETEESKVQPSQLHLVIVRQSRVVEARLSSMHLIPQTESQTKKTTTTTNMVVVCKHNLEGPITLGVVEVMVVVVWITFFGSISMEKA